jgi:hypothetical protein
VRLAEGTYLKYFTVNAAHTVIFWP